MDIELRHIMDIASMAREINMDTREKPLGHRLAMDGPMRFNLTSSILPTIGELSFRCHWLSCCLYWCSEDECIKVNITDMGK